MKLIGCALVLAFVLMSQGAAQREDNSPPNLKYRLLSSGPRLHWRQATRAIRRRHSEPTGDESRLGGIDLTVGWSDDPARRDLAAEAGV